MVSWSMVVGGGVLCTALIAGCGSGSGAPAASSGGGGQTVTATLKDLTLTLDKNTANKGDITFKADNKGAIVHELVVLKTDTPFDKLPQKDGLVEESAGAVIDEIEDVPAGKAKSKAIKLEVGKYILLCNVAGHYAAGMRAAFTVQ